MFVGFKSAPNWWLIFRFEKCLGVKNGQDVTRLGQLWLVLVRLWDCLICLNSLGFKIGCFDLQYRPDKLKYYDDFDKLT